MATGAPILLQIAMAAEAGPFRAGHPFTEWAPLAPPLPALACSATIRGRLVHLVIPGADPRHGVDLIGTQPAAVTAYAAMCRFRPALVVNGGTAGGFAREGAAIGDICISHGPAVFHDRRVPLGAFAAAGVGSYPTLDCRILAAELGHRLARLTTGDSLDFSEADARQLACAASRDPGDRNDAASATSGTHALPHAKDMEAAAIAWVASVFGVPFVGVKAITDLVDGEHPTADQFERNLGVAVERLAGALTDVLAALAGTEVGARARHA